MSFHVLEPGFASRVVDLGRPVTRALGVPIGGAADRAAFMLGNALAGNSPNAPALEICLKGPVLRAEVTMGCVLFGAPFTLAGARRPLAANKTFTLRAGEELQIGVCDHGMRAYFCVRGGLVGQAVLGSFSALDVIKAGETIACAESKLGRRFFPPSVQETLSQDRFSLRVLPGLQEKRFEEEGFCDAEFTVTPSLNRMGIRLEGRPMVMKEEMVSEPVCPGSVQVTHEGQSIVLGIDGQTIGGYPKIAQIIQADLDHLGQIRPGDIIRFRQVDQAEAVASFRKRQGFIQEWSNRALLSLEGWER